MNETVSKPVRGPTENGEADRPRVTVPPPLIIGIPFAVGMVLQWLFPLRFPPRWIGLSLGVLCGLPAVVLLFTARIAFRRARTSMIPTYPSRAMLVDGPFRFTRNPLYVGLVLLYAGISLGTSTAWPLLFLPIIVIALHHLAILPEERYLEHRYGDEYRAYKTRVRRWI